jgi:hypothetical protein
VDDRERRGALALAVLGALLIAIDVAFSFALFALAGVLLIAFRRRWRNILFSAITVSICLLAIEGVARMRVARQVAGPSRPATLRDDQVLNHRWVPNLSVVDDARSIPYTLRTNAQTWLCDHDVALEKPAGTWRVFYVGDSNVQGVVAEEKKMVTLVARGLDEMCRPRGFRVEAINTGTSSYSNILYYLLIKNELLRYHPDLVVINMDMTDVVNDYDYRPVAIFNSFHEPVAVTTHDLATREASRMTPTGTVRLSFAERLRIWLVYHSEACRFLAEKLSRPPPPPPTTDEPANWLRLQWTDEIQKNVDESMRYLVLAVDLCRKAGVRVFVTGVPHYPQFTGAWSTKPHEELARVAKENGFLFLDSYEKLAPSVKNNPQGKFYWDEDPTHFNEAGNALWAEVQLGFFREHRDALLP